jgi:hypothetical protein
MLLDAARLFLIWNDLRGRPVGSASLPARLIFAGDPIRVGARSVGLTPDWIIVVETKLLFGFGSKPTPATAGERKLAPIAGPMAFGGLPESVRVTV